MYRVLAKTISKNTLNSTGEKVGDSFLDFRRALHNILMMNNICKYKKRI